MKSESRTKAVRANQSSIHRLALTSLRAKKRKQMAKTARVRVIMIAA
jgi:hypothetical protein